MYLRIVQIKNNSVEIFRICYTITYSIQHNHIFFAFSYPDQWSVSHLSFETKMRGYNNVHNAETCSSTRQLQKKNWYHLFFQTLTACTWPHTYEDHFVATKTLLFYHVILKMVFVQTLIIVHVYYCLPVKLVHIYNSKTSLKTQFIFNRL